jgi:hypothetical protein
MTLSEMLGSLGLFCAAIAGFCWGLGYGFWWAMAGGILGGFVGWAFGVLIAHLSV